MRSCGSHNSEPIPYKELNPEARRLDPGNYISWHASHAASWTTSPNVLRAREKTTSPGEPREAGSGAIFRGAD